MTDKTTGEVISPAWQEAINDYAENGIIDSTIHWQREKDMILSFQLTVSPDEKEKWLNGEIDKIAVIGFMTRTKG